MLGNIPGYKWYRFRPWDKYVDDSDDDNVDDDYGL